MIQVEVLLMPRKMPWLSLAELAQLVKATQAFSTMPPTALAGASAEDGGNTKKESGNFVSTFATTSSWQQALEAILPAKRSSLGEWLWQTISLPHQT